MSVAEAQAAIATALEAVQAEIPELQVYGYWNPHPSPPSLDVYPGDPFQVGAGFGVGMKLLAFTVRARVAMVDDEAGQKLLLRLLDVGDPASVEAALAAADAGVVGNDGSVSGFRQYEGGEGTAGLLGCEWRVEAFT